jgi:hypothetical protein
MDEKTEEQNCRFEILIATDFGLVAYYIRIRLLFADVIPQKLFFTKVIYK